MTLRRKHKATNDEWRSAWLHARDAVPLRRVDQLIDQASERIAPLASLRTGYGWSGGKDSQALRLVVDRSSIAPLPMIALSNGLDYPAFERFVEDHGPPGLTVKRTQHTLCWLVAHPLMLFPKEQRLVDHWSASLHRAAQDRFVREHRLDAMVYGRRGLDGNIVKGGMYRRRDGLIVVNPIHDWTHEEVLATAAWYELPMPPIYEYPNGWDVGTGPWAKRVCSSTLEGWRTTMTCDPEILRRAMSIFPEARQVFEAA